MPSVLQSSGYQCVLYGSLIIGRKKGSLASFHSIYSNPIPALCKGLGWALVIWKRWSKWRGRITASSSWFLKHSLLDRRQPRIERQTWGLATVSLSWGDMTLPKSPNLCLSVIGTCGDDASLLSCYDSEYLIAFCKQSSTGLLSRLILAESPFLSGWVCGFATWQKSPEDGWPTPSSWREDLAGVIPNGCEACWNAGSAELWSSAG